MARVTTIRNDFLSGEVSPRLYNRTDLDLFKSSCRTLENYYVYPHGGISKRQGTKFLGYAGDSNNSVRLISFQYSAIESYIIEMGNYYMRFFTYDDDDGESGQVYTAPISAGGVPYEIYSPYSSDEIFQVKYVQSADTMYLAHPDHYPQQLTRAGAADWTLTDVEFYGGPFQDQNSEEYVKITPSDTTGNITLTAYDVIDDDFSADISGWNRVAGEVNWEEDKEMLELEALAETDKLVNISKDYEWLLSFDCYGGPVDVTVSYESSGSSFTIDTSAASGSDVTVSFTPSADDCYVGFQNNNGFPVWIDNVSLQPKIWDENHVGAFWKIVGAKSVSKSCGAEDTWSDSIMIEEGDVFVVSTAGTWSATVTLQRSSDNTNFADFATYTTNNSISYSEIQEQNYYRIGIDTGDYTSGTAECKIELLDQYGYVKLTDVATSSVFASGSVEKTLPKTDATYRWAEGSWSDENGYPGSVAFYENRLVFAGTSEEPQTLWASQTDDYTNYENENNDDDESYSFTLASTDINTIRWMTDVSVLICGTHGGEWRFGDKDEATTPSSVFAKRQTSDGSANLQPLVVGHHVIYVQRGTSKIRRLTYDYATESWISPEISARAEHLFTEGVVDLAYASKPDNQLYFVMEDGDMISLTYDPLIAEIVAFSVNNTEGYFESVATIPGTDRDEVWVVAKRNVNGTDYRFIEQMQTSNWTNHEDAYYLDSALEGNFSTPQSSAAGLSHLAGETVSILADGAVHPNKTVSATGTISLDYAVSKIIVGLPYTAKVTTMDLNAGAKFGTSMSKKRIIHGVDIYFYNSLEIDYGYEGETIDTLPFRVTSDILGQSPSLFTGYKEMAFPKGYDNEIYVSLQHTNPLPSTILSIVVTMTTNEL